MSVVLCAASGRLASLASEKRVRFCPDCGQVVPLDDDGKLIIHVTESRAGVTPGEPQ